MEKIIMNNKKILVSFLLVVLIAISLGSVSAADSADVLSDNATSIEPASASVADVQTAVDSAKNVGDTVDLSKNAEYDFTNQTVTINNPGIIIDGKGTTTIKGHGDGQGIFRINAQNVTIQGIKFIDTNPKNDFKYNGSTNGWGISASAANGGLVQNCEFQDFNSGIVIMQTTGFTVENNKFTGGYTTQLLNDPTVNKETGSKSLNIYRQSSGVMVKNNTFDGPILDGVSIAQGSGANYVIGNTFINNCYSIYFGGASTKGSKIENNTFINCGYFEEGDIKWEGLPVISMQKASDDISVENNHFFVRSDNVLIAAEKGNEAHGSPTPIGNINITSNTVELNSPDGNMANVILFHILVRDGASGLNITSPIIVAENVLNGATGISIWFDDNEILSANNIILNETLDANQYYGAKTLYTTEISTDNVAVKAGDAGKLYAYLFDNTGVALSNKDVTIVIDGEAQTVKTDDDGCASLDVKYASATTKYATIIYAGEGNLYKSSMATAKISVTKKATALTAAKTTLKVKKAKKVTITLKSAGKAVAGKKITIKVNGKTFSAKTNSKGKATISVKVLKKGKFNAVVKFAGDGAYNAVTKTVKYTVK